MADEAALLTDLLEAYSPTGDEAAGVRAFVRVAARLGFAVETDAVGNGIARCGRGRPQIVYLGHIDTVPGRIPVRREGSRILGRGACDAKGPLLSALLARPEVLPQGELVVVASVGEESDSRGAKHLIPSLAPEAVIAGEPSGWNGIAIGYKGDLRLRARIRGERRHLSAPDLSTTERAMDWACAVRELSDTGVDRFHSLTVKVDAIRSGESAGRESVEVVVDLRIPPGRTVESVAASLPPLTAADSIETIASIEPFESGRSDPVVRALVDGIRAQGGRPTLWRKGGTSDLNIVAPAWGLGGAAYGPGDAHLDHTDEEALDLADLNTSAEVLRVAFRQLLEGLTPRGSGSGGG